MNHCDQPPKPDRAAALTLKRVRLADLKPHKSNPRTHPEPGSPAWDALKRSLEASYFEPLVINSGRKVKSLRNVIVSGHLRVKVLITEGYTHADAVIVDYSEQRHVEVMLRANNQTGEWDEQALAALLKDIPEADLDLTGFDAAEIDRLLAGLEPDKEAPEPQLDRAEELRKKWGTEPGQLWQIGEHRLLCGDCRKAKDVSRLMNGEKANIAFTSPPYAEQREYNKDSGFKPIPPAEFVDWYEPVQRNVAQHLHPDGSWFVNIKPCAEGLDTNLYVFDLVIAHVRLWGWHFATEFCWERNGVPKQVVTRFKNQFEPVYQFAKSKWKIRPEHVMHESSGAIISLGAGSGNTGWADRQGKGGVIPQNRRAKRPRKTAASQQGIPLLDMFKGDRINGMAYPGNRIESFDSTHDALGHSAAFPPGLPKWFASAFTDPGDCVYDCFTGSGSTLVACEQLKRRGRGIEIDPGYCAVTLQRLADMGLKPGRSEV